MYFITVHKLYHSMTLSPTSHHVHTYKVTAVWCVTILHLVGEREKREGVCIHTCETRDHTTSNKYQSKLGTKESICVLLSMSYLGLMMFRSHEKVVIMYHFSVLPAH